MPTFGRSVDGQITDVCVGPSVAAATAAAFAPAYVTQYGPWIQVPDGTVENAAIDGQGNVTNPPPQVYVPQPIALTKSQFEALYAANNSNITATLAAWPVQ